MNLIEGFPPKDQPTLEGALTSRAKMLFHRVLTDIMHREAFPDMGLRYEPASMSVGPRFYESLVMERGSDNRTFHMLMHDQNPDKGKVGVVFVITKDKVLKSQQAFEVNPELFVYTSFHTVQFMLERCGQFTDKLEVEKILDPIYKDLPEEFRLRLTIMAREKSKPLIVPDAPDIQE